MLDAMTPEEFDELVAWNEIEPIGAGPFHRLLVFVATVLANQFREEDPVTMESVAEFAGLPASAFEEKDEPLTGSQFAASIPHR